MSLPCQAILFDLDGVLIDSDAAIRQRWRRWANHRDVPFEEVEAVYHGRPAVEVIEEVAPHLDAEAETERMGAVTSEEADVLTAFEGVYTLIEGLPDDQWTIATSARRRTATARLTHVGLPIPETLVTADDVEYGKPAPEPYRLAARRLGVEPRHCVVFEDSPAGVAAAQQAGAQVIAVTTTSSPRNLAAADVVVGLLANVEIQSAENGGLHVGVLGSTSNAVP